MDIVEVLNSALCGQSVVVPSNWIKDVFATHPLITGQTVLVRVTENMPHMERTTHGGWWCVN